MHIDGAVSVFKSDDLVTGEWAAAVAVVEWTERLFEAQPVE